MLTIFFFCFIVSCGSYTSSFKEPYNFSWSCWCHRSCLFCRYFGISDCRSKFFFHISLLFFFFFLYNFITIFSMFFHTLRAKLMSSEVLSSHQISLYCFERLLCVGCFYFLLIYMCVLY